MTKEAIFNGTRNKLRLVKRVNYGGKYNVDIREINWQILKGETNTLSSLSCRLN